MNIKNYLLSSKEAHKLYEKAKALPIIDYHCHLSPKEIFLDEPFENIGQTWLAGDHYKWRIMREAGIGEEYVTGSASFHDKFLKFADAVSLAAGNPVYHWTAMELEKYFGITEPLDPDSAERIWEKANRVIKETAMSPRKLILGSGVEYLATTDDPTDSLEYHALLRDDKDFGVTVAPSFRTDRVLLINAKDYPDYIAKLSDVSDTKITDIDSLCEALIKRLDHFVKNGCRFTDVGIAFFPDREPSMEEADKAFCSALSGKEADRDGCMNFLAYMYRFLGKEYKKRNLVMQLHLAVYRNACTSLFEKKGGDAGGDCIGDPIKVSDIIRVLDGIDREGGLPLTILYTLDPSIAPALASAANSFRNVLMGAAWWFCDHKRGIEEQIKVISEAGNISSFLGMLTDSRSFLSYARHDYFRRILCSVIADWVDKGEFDKKQANELVRRICYSNIKKVIS